MIVVLGSLALREAPAATPVGRAPEIAIAAAARGATAEVVGRVGDDRAGDTLLIALAGARVGHAAVLRDPVHATPLVAPPSADDDPDPFAEDAPAPVAATGGGPRLEPADVALGLSYLTSFGVLVVADDVPAAALPACIEGAQFAGAHLVVLLASGRRPPATLPADATVLVAPVDADDGAFAALVGAYAAAVDAGEEPAAAFRIATGAVGWETAAADA
jgi:sugar/nucleoside kinase (ribokinase family)